MSNLNKKDKTNLDDIDRDISTHRRLTIFIVIAVLGLYGVLRNTKLPETVEAWGTVGDFFGGILNPIFALFAFYWLTYSVRLQIKELRETKKELKKSAKAQKAIAKLERKNLKLQTGIIKAQRHSNQTQQDQIALQNFVSFFLELFKTKDLIMQDLKFNIMNIELTQRTFEKLGDKTSEISVGKDAIKNHILIFKKNNHGPWEDYYNKNMMHYYNSYFKIFDLILRLLVQNIDYENNNYFGKEQYLDMFSSSLSQFEYEAVFFYGLSDRGTSGLKEIIEEIGLFGNMHVELRSNVINLRDLTSKAYLYNKKAFRDSDIWRNYFNQFEKLDRKITIDEFQELYELFLKVGLIELNYTYTKYSLNVMYENLLPSEIVENENLIKIISEQNSLYSNIINQIKFLEDDLISHKKYIEEVENVYMQKNEKCEDVDVESGKFFFNSPITYNLSNIRKELKEKEKELESISERKKDLLANFDKIKNSKKLLETIFILKYRVDINEFMN